MCVFVLKRVSSSKKKNKNLYTFSLLGSDTENCALTLCSTKVRSGQSRSGQVKCVFYFLVLWTSAGSSQICLLDIFLGQVLSFFYSWYLSQIAVSQVLSFLFCFVCEPGRSGPGALFFAWYLSQIQVVPADFEKRVFIVLLFATVTNNHTSAPVEKSKTQWRPPPIPTWSALTGPSAFALRWEPCKGLGG